MEISTRLYDCDPPSLFIPLYIICLNRCWENNLCNRLVITPVTQLQFLVNGSMITSGKKTTLKQHLFPSWGGSDPKEGNKDKDSSCCSQTGENDLPCRESSSQMIVATCRKMAGPSSTRTQKVCGLLYPGEQEGRGLFSEFSSVW